MVGVLLLALGGETWRSFVEPGPLTNAHAQIADCSACHASAEGSPLKWIAAAFGGLRATPGDSERCVRCHSVGAVPFAPHGLPKADLTLLQDTRHAGSGNETVPLMLRLARAAASGTVDELQCGLCHREHRDVGALRLTGDRCQICHTVAFSGLADGHPAFSNYPAKRRTRINFDHVAHIGKYFAEKADLSPPKDCTSCHEPDSGGRRMLVNSFDVGCGACHLGDIEGAKRADAKGLAFLQVPGLDLESLRKRGVPIGEWPESAEARLSPLTDFLLSTDDAYLSARGRLQKVDLTDLPDSEYDADVQTLAWGLKALLDDLQRGGGLAFERRLSKAFAMPLSAEKKRAMVGQVPGAVVDEVQREWFPQLADELQRHRAGLATPLNAIRPARPAKEVQRKPEKVQPAAFDSLFGGGLLADGDSAGKAAAAAPTAQPERPALNAEQRLPFGGWYHDDDALRYRPSGHADSLLRAWLDASRGRPLFNVLADAKKNPGACTKCHSVDEPEGGTAVVNWLPLRVNPKMHSFTVFSHVKHFSLLGNKGCSTCHVADRKADYQAGFSGRNPRTFASNFASINRDTCVECHTAKMAGEDCTLCHRYHVGEFSPTMPQAAIDRMLEPAPKR